MNYNQLTKQQARIIVTKGTEPPFSGEFDSFFRPGVYICKRCNSPLFSSKAKFDAGCGWPAFESTLPGALKRVPDADHLRTEIQCAHCQAHLGYVFEDEQFTSTNTRHCVNSLSLSFIPQGEPLPEVLSAD